MLRPSCKQYARRADASGAGERLALLQAQIDDLEQARAAYASQPEQCDDARLDVFFDELTERLQGIGQLCRTCRRRMEGTTWELFVRLLLAEQERES